MRRGHTALLPVILVTLPALVGAQGIERVAQDARTTGRAGTGVVSADGHAALYTNPAGIARRSGWRAQIELAVLDRGATYRRDRTVAGLAPPTVEERGSAAWIPTLGLQADLGQRVTLGLSFLWPTGLGFTYPGPLIYDRGPAPDGNHQHAGRYASSRFQLRRRGAALGAAVRLLPWLAAGAAVHWTDVRLRQEKTLWAGLDTEAQSESDYFEKDFDMQAAFEGSDAFVPGASLGLVVAPEDAPVELAASVVVFDGAELRGPVRIAPSRGIENGMRLAVAFLEPGAEASMRLSMPLVVRGGVRFLTDRATFEVESELTHVHARDPRWTLRGVRIARVDGLETELTSVSAATSLRPTFSVRGAADVDVVPGFLALTTGYAYRQGQVRPSDLSPAFPSLDSHTVAFGLEARQETATLHLGASHTFASPRTIPSQSSSVRQEHPFATALIPAAGGRYDARTTQVSLGIDMSF